MIVWVKAYIPEWDGEIALQVDDQGAVRDAVARGVVCVVSEDDALQTNERFARMGEGAAKFLEEKLAARKKHLELSK